MDAVNPFDPAEIAVVVETGAPSGHHGAVAAFVTRNHHRELRDGRERLTADSELRWAARILPDEAGTWRRSWRSETSGGVALGAWHELRVGRAGVNSHGIARPRPSAAALGPRDQGQSNPDAGSPRSASFSGRYVAFDDGTPFVPIRENMAWPDARGTFAHEVWLDRLVAHGGNYRLPVPRRRRSPVTRDLAAAHELGNRASTQNATLSVDDPDGFRCGPLRSPGGREPAGAKNKGVPSQNPGFGFAPLAELVRGVDFPAQEFAVSEQQASHPGGRRLRALSLRGEAVALVWIDDVGHRWAAPDPEEVVAATLAHDALVPGRWRFAWYDTRTGARLGQGDRWVAQDGQITLAVPPFRRDVALRLDRRTR